LPLATGGGARAAARDAATWFDVLAFIKSHEKEAVQIMAKVVEQKPEDYLAFMPGTKFFDVKANLHAFEKRGDDSSLSGSGKKIAGFLKGLDLIKTIPDYDAALEDAPAGHPGEEEQDRCQLDRHHRGDEEQAAPAMHVATLRRIECDVAKQERERASQPRTT
jgi:hypothetical protein